MLNISDEPDLQVATSFTQKTFVRDKGSEDSKNQFESKEVSWANFRQL